MDKDKTENQKKLLLAVEQVNEVVKTMEPKVAIKFLLEFIDVLVAGMTEARERDLDYIRTRYKNKHKEDVSKLTIV